MAEFFVAKEASGELGNLVHDKDCDQITPVENFKYLGSFATKEAAMNKAKGYFYTVSYCSSCITEKASSEAQAA